MHIRVGCEFRYEATWPTPTVMMVQPYPDKAYRVVQESWQNTPDVAMHAFNDIYGNVSQRYMLIEGENVIRYDALVAVTDEYDEYKPDAKQMAVEDLPDDVLLYTLPSRFCLSDMLSDTAWQLFGQTEPGWGRVQAICDWVHDNIQFKYGTSNALTTAVDIYEQKIGVCRDLTHLAVTFCRALNIPTRYVFGYLPDIAVPVPDDPMDFCAWMEVYLDGRWWTFDPRNNARRIGRVLIGRGRDALDVAMVTTYGGPRLAQMTVWADEEVQKASAVTAQKETTSDL